MALDLSSLKKVVASIERALNFSTSEKMGTLSNDEQEVIKAGVIQNFEFTYELCWKFMKRWLEMNVSPTAADGVTRRELFRQAAEQRLIVDVDQWMRHHDARNQTAHTYDPKIAEKVYVAAHDFARDAQRLLKALENRND